MTPPPSEPAETVVELTGITKRYPGTLANDAVDLSVRRGEIHALMGENGAGKSTLMSVLYGTERPDAGTIRIHGREVDFSGPADAIAAGLGMVHQSFRLFDSLTVAENVVFRAEPRRFGLLDRAAARRRVRELAEEHGLPVDPDARVGDLPVGVRQRVEILKLLYRGARVLILDEPTAVLTPDEAVRLFAVLESLAAQGRSVILVTHKLHEVLEGAHNVTVLRDGRVTARLRTADTTAAEIAGAMTGRRVELDRVHPPGTPGEVVLSVSGVRGVDLTVRAGEIVGIAGVAGNGQSELIEALAGLRPVEAGRIELTGHDITHASPAARRAAGLAYIPEDRAAVGTAPAASVADNLAMGHHRRPPATRHGLLRPAALRAHARSLIERFGIKTPSPGTPAGALSGGNLQKLLVGRELAHDAPLLLVEQPTRGVDVGAIQQIHEQLIAYRDAGHAVLLVSAELSEIRSLSDRILVMYEGRISASHTRDDADEHSLGLAMAGAGTAN
ncbi:ABC transporter ATP-binding protein [Streptomyces sp. NPDC059385]|uniref:ABC transporter ATP-binding protein n=1 Tax=Streptomyces sp. NPDC059385 TaxID=3346817 RepID=UPI003674F92C